MTEYIYDLENNLTGITDASGTGYSHGEGRGDAVVAVDMFAWREYDRFSGAAGNEVRIDGM